MKGSLSKPISSPGRADKFPPPLLRFLRSNVGSRSTKGNRSRASPMFFIRTNKKSLIETAQEPSSPKVTCIGQVRVRRSKKTTSIKKKPRRSCCWFRKPVFSCKICPRFRVKWRPFKGFSWKWRPFKRFGGKCASFFRFGYCKKVDATQDSFRPVSRTNNNQKCEKTETLVVSIGNDDDKFGGLIEENRRNSVDLCSSSTPPKNAFLLTRCRSAPYRSSSLGGRFWGSPVKKEDLGGNESEESSESKLEESENQSSTSCASSVVVEVEGSEEMEEDKVVVVVEENLKVVGIGPLLLTRCKSEPARTGERLVPEANFWKQRRSGVVEPCSSHHSNS